MTVFFFFFSRGTKSDTRLSQLKGEKSEREDSALERREGETKRLYYEGRRETFIILFRRSEASNLVL